MRSCASDVDVEGLRTCASGLRLSEILPTSPDAQERIPTSKRVPPCTSHPYQNLKLELIHVFLGEDRWRTEQENFCGRIILHRL